MKRREFIAISATTAVWLLAGCGGGDSTVSTAPGGNSPEGGNPTNPGSGNPGSGNPGDPENETPDNPTNPDNPGSGSSDVGELAIPPLLDPVPVGGIKQFDLTIQEGSKEFFPGIHTETYGISADYLGPTLLLRKDEQVSINYTNELKEATTMHGHGMHLPAAMDGGPHQIIEPGETWSAKYTVNQKACTNWYHPHKMGKTAEHVYMGLAGMIIVEDDESIALDLPNRYGIDDIPLVIQDKVFDTNGQIDYSPSQMEIRRGLMGNNFLVNGIIQPYFNAEAKELRLRLLNGSNARVYQFAFDDNRNFSQIATDNSFLPSPVSLSRLTLSPGERAEIIVDLTSDRGESVILKDLSSGTELLTINVNKEAIASTSLPAVLTSTLEIPDASKAVNTRSFRLNMSSMHMAINGKLMDLNRIDETVPLGDLELWEITNTMGMNHNFHIHATHFNIIERNGSATNVLPNEKGYKDVVFLPPNSSVKVLVRMTDYSDNINPYMYHCHVLEHEDDGMMGQFLVI